MVGRILSHYRIVEEIGRGGMGEVFIAEDMKLGRRVALKLLPPEMAEIESRRKRFEREARAVAALNHPNIVTVHSVEEAEGLCFITMELVRGRVLSDLVPTSGLSLKRFFDVAIPLADAVAAAHQAGITHRDLKPSNVMVSEDGRVKVLDFGLAKPDRGLMALEANELSTVEKTAQSAVVGTIHYMSPEQAQGRNVDHRTDVFSLGVVFYEMLTGRRPFESDTAVGTLSAILNETPFSIRELRPDVPRELVKVIERCLAKDVSRRIQTALDVRNELEEVRKDLESGELLEKMPPTETRRRSRRWTGGGAVAALLLLLLLAAAMWAFLGKKYANSRETAAIPLARFAIELKSDEFLHEYNSASVAISPDGARIAYVANRGTERAIYVRALDELESRRIAGTERASSPFFSPDGEWLAFAADGKLKRVHVSGGDAELVAKLPYFGGASWGPGDEIVYTPAFMRGLFVVSSQGGTPRQLTTPQQNHAHIWPQVLPDGNTVLFTIWTGTTWDQASIGLLSLDTGKWSVLVESGFYGRFAPTGHLLYLRGGTLFAAPFDVKQRKLTGSSTAVLEGVLHDGFNGGGFFAVSSTGTLVYAPGTSQPPPRRLVWVDPSGRRTPITGTARPYSSPRVSPRGDRIALFLDGASLSIWDYEISRDTLARVSFGSDDHTVAWSPDGTRIAFESGREGVHQLYVTAASGSGEPLQLTRGEFDHYLCDWSPNGSTLAYVEFHPETSADLWLVDVDHPDHPRAFLRSPFYEKQATFSPDGRWLAYASDESGQFEVYVQPFPGPGPKRLVSRGGGEEPAWSRSGKRLFYRSGGRMMSVAVTEGSEFTADRPEVLFEGLFHYADFPSRSYDLAPDGRFVMVAEPEPEQGRRELDVVLNWTQQLKSVER